MSADALSAARPRLVALAYRFLGSIADAEDVVQTAWLRWQAADREAVAEPAAFLARTVARLCLDELKSARRRRETYIGPWLPEPVVEPAPLAEREAAEDLSVALMLALERLSPLERAAYLLHDIFGLPFQDVAASLDRAPEAVRQLAARARSHVQAARPRFPVLPEEGARIAAAFRTALDTGDTDGLRSLLAEDAVFHADGGGVVPAALNPILGAERIVRFLAGILAKRHGTPEHRPATVNGLPGFVTRLDGTVQTTALDIEAGRIRAIYVVRNPDKLTRLGPG